MSRAPRRVKSDQRSAVIYFTVSRAGDLCHIGYSTNLERRLNGTNNTGFKLHSAIVGDETQETQLHSYFASLAVDDAPGNELFHLREPLIGYLEFLGERGYVATNLEELPTIYPHPARFPWISHDVRVGTQRKLEGFDEIVPGLRRPLTRSQRIAATISSDSDEWYTPAVYVEAARRVMGSIDIDPASCPLANLTVRAKEIYTRTEDGLSYEWHGNVWLNPPYGNEKDKFVAHLFEEYEAGHVTQAVMCLNAHATDTVWFQSLWTYPVCLTHHRVRFRGGVNGRSLADSAPTTGTAFVYVGQDEERFADEFSRFGPVLHLMREASTSAEEFRSLQSADEDWETE